MYFAATGRVDLPPLPRLTKRDCRLYIEPNEEQLADNDNIYGLVWRTRKALKEFRYADRTIKYYDVSGFAKILDAHEVARTEIYSRKLSATLVLDAEKLVESGKQRRYQAVRKAAAQTELNSYARKKRSQSHATSYDGRCSIEYKNIAT